MPFSRRFLVVALLPFTGAACSEAADAPGGSEEGGATGGVVGGVPEGGSGGQSLGVGGSPGTGGTAPGTGGVGAGGTPLGSGGTGGSDDLGSGGSPASFSLTSPDHAEGAMFASPYTCAQAGFNGSILPELNWTAGPPGTESYAITFIDTFLAPGSDLGYHWVIYNIPATVSSLAEGLKDVASIGAAQSGNFLGPCPNFGGGTDEHSYEFTLYALDTPTLSLTPTTGTDAVKDADSKLEAANLQWVKLRGTSTAQPPAP